MVAWEPLASLDHEGEARVPIARQGDRLAAGHGQPRCALVGPAVLCADDRAYPLLDEVRGASEPAIPLALRSRTSADRGSEQERGQSLLGGDPAVAVVERELGGLVVPLTATDPAVHIDVLELLREQRLVILRRRVRRAGGDQQLGPGFWARGGDEEVGDAGTRLSGL